MASLLVGIGHGTHHILAHANVDMIFRTRVREHLGTVHVQHVHHTLADAVASTEYYSHLVAEHVIDMCYRVGLGILQLEQFVEHVCILTICKLHVALFATHHEYGFVGIAAHNATVVGGLERRVFQRTFIGFGYELTVESLRSLSATQT